MAEIKFEPRTSEINQNSGRENRGYARSQSDHHFPTFEEERILKLKHLPRIASAAASTFPIIYEAPIDTDTADISFPSPTIPLPSSTSSIVDNHHSHRRSTSLEQFERQSSLIDPMSDRVSTILVWQYLTVSTRENKHKEFLQRMKSSKNFVPKRKCLLHNVSGAITGGLWAVMGKCFAFPL